MKSQHQQQGSTLLVSLIFLVVITLFGVSAINTSSLNLRIAANSQFQTQAEAAAQLGIEQAIGSLTTFTSPSVQTITLDVNKDGTTDYTATVSAATCLSSKAASGYSAEYCATGACPNDTNWELVSTVNDAATGAKVTVRQGVKVRLPSSATC
jgi:Tfp pilus assembly protein PilX